MKRTVTHEAQSGRVTATIRSGGAASLRLDTAPSGGPMYEDDGQSVTVDLALVVELMREAGYRVEAPKESSVTKALLLEAAEIIDGEFGTRKGTHPIVAQLRKAAER